jgi:hypothetical protein
MQNQKKRTIQPLTEWPNNITLLRKVSSRGSLERMSASGFGLAALSGTMIAQRLR